ncbi:hypothetical protein QL285_085172 [Trifolium repens]|jgi:hypothetical protein|nr:hypothetical protein QL285_085172 [Trifolium repens]
MHGLGRVKKKSREAVTSSELVLIPPSIEKYINNVDRKHPQLPPKESSSNIARILQTNQTQKSYILKPYISIPLQYLFYASINAEC